VKKLSRKLGRIVVGCVLSAEIALAGYVVYLFAQFFFR
jgi:hypothetical protein